MCTTLSGSQRLVKGSSGHVCKSLDHMKYAVFPVLFSRHSVHKPSRPWLEPARVQLDWQKGGPVGKSQPDYTVLQVPAVLPGYPQIKVLHLSSRVSLRNEIHIVMSVWREMLRCDTTQRWTVQQWAETNRDWLRKAGRHPAFCCIGSLASSNTSNITATADSKNRKQRRNNRKCTTVQYHKDIHG